MVSLLPERRFQGKALSMLMGPRALERQTGDAGLPGASLVAARPVKTEFQSQCGTCSFRAFLPRGTHPIQGSDKSCGKAMFRFSSAQLDPSSSLASKPTPVLCSSAHVGKPHGSCRCRQLIVGCSWETLACGLAPGRPAERSDFGVTRATELEVLACRVIPQCVLGHPHKYKTLGSREGQRSDLF